MIYNVVITLKSGLHIGSGNAKVEIGGMDQPVMKDKDGLPYIPASSLKGKLRSLYETHRFSDDLIKNREKNSSGLKTFNGVDYDEVSMFFGKAGDYGNIKDDNKIQLENLGPTRFIFRDLKLSKNSLLEFKKKIDSGNSFYEEKTEVSIDRFTGTSLKGALRQIERVPAGTVFEGDLIVRFFEKKEILEQWEKNTGKEIKSEKDILEAQFGKNLGELKKMIENDYLGGQGSRGSGEIMIEFIEKINEENQ